MVGYNIHDTIALYSTNDKVLDGHASLTLGHAFKWFRTSRIARDANKGLSRPLTAHLPCCELVLFCPMLYEVAIEWFSGRHPYVLQLGLEATV